MPSPGSGAPAATPSPSPDRLRAAGFVGAEARGSLGARPGVGVGEGQGGSLPCRARAPAAGDRGSLASEPLASLRCRGPGRKEVCPRAGGRGSVRLRVPGQPPGGGQGVPRVTCAGAHGGWAAAAGSCPRPKGQRGARAALPAPGRSVAAAVPCSPGLRALKAPGVASALVAGGSPAVATHSFSCPSQPRPLPALCHRGAPTAEGAGTQRRLG